MDILFLLIPLSVVLVFIIGAVFWLALKGGQFDDLESPGLDVVLDDDKPQPDPPGSKVRSGGGGKESQTGSRGSEG